MQNSKIMKRKISVISLLFSIITIFFLSLAMRPLLHSGNIISTSYSSAKTLSPLDLIMYAVLGIDPQHTPRGLSFSINPTQVTPVANDELFLPNTDSPQYSVSFISGFSPYNTTTMERLCISLYPQNFGEDEFFSVLWLIRQTIVNMDASTVFTWDDYHITSLELQQSFNEEGSPVPQYDFPATLCIDTNDLGLGSYTVTVVTDIGTREYSESFSLEILTVVRE
jgi:hypothetical protein